VTDKGSSGTGSPRPARDAPAPMGFRARLRDDRRFQATVAVAAAAIVAMVVGVVGLLTAGGGTSPPPPPDPLVVRLPTDLSGVYSVTGEPSRLDEADLRAVTATVRGYLEAATIAPLEADPDPDASTTAPDRPARPLSSFFTDAAAARLDGPDRIALSDAHLPHALHQVSTDFARLPTLTALVGEDGRGLVVAVSLDVRMRVRTGDLDLEGDADVDAVVVRRRGDLVLQPVDGAWRIGGYQLRVERRYGTATTTTSEAAFGT